MATIQEYNDFKREKESEHAQRSTDFAIINFLKYALCSMILVDDVPDNNSQVTVSLTQDSSPNNTLQSCVCHQSSPELDPCDGDSETMIISGDLSDVTTTNSTTPERLPKHFRDSLCPPYNINMTHGKTLSGEEMLDIPDHISHEVIQSVEWKL